MSSAAEAYVALRRHGASVADATLLTAIGGAESGWNLAAVGDVGLESATWGPSYGIWQIRTLKADTGRGTPRDINQLRTGIDAQAAATMAIRRGQGLKAWSTYSSGSYTGYLTQAKAAAGAAPSTVTNPGTTRAGMDPGPNASNVGLIPTLPGGNLDPLNWPGAIVNGVTGAAGNAAANVAQGLWSQIQPVFVTSLFAVGGIALVIVGLAAAAKPIVGPAVEAATDKAESAAKTAAMTGAI